MKKETAQCLKPGTVSLLFWWTRKNPYIIMDDNSSEHQRNEKSDYANLFAIGWIFYFGMGGTPISLRQKLRMQRERMQCAGLWPVVLNVLNSYWYFIIISEPCGFPAQSAPHRLMSEHFEPENTRPGFTKIYCISARSISRTILAATAVDAPLAS